MIQKKLLAFFTLLTLYTLLSSHEFWLNPDKFIYNRTDKINVRFFVGENFEGGNWKGNNEKIKSLKIYYGGVSDDLSACVTDVSGDSIEFSMIDEGTSLIAFNSTNSFIEIDSAKFNEYLREDGLTNALEYRGQNNETDSIGREFYQRCAKTLIQVGPVKDKTFSITTGIPVDIIPALNPYLLKNNDSLRAKILYNGSPLINAVIKTWHRVKDKTEKAEFVTDENGEVIFPVTTNGKWMVSTVKIEKLENDPKAQWQSYWGTLTWGYE